MGKACNILFGKPEGKRPLGRSRMGLREIGWEIVDWINLAQGKGWR
jgi:hypothetical protein